MKEYRIIITGGGTGGHLYPGIALAREFEKNTPCKILFVGTKRGVEASVVPDYGYDLNFVWISGISRGRVLKNLLFPLKMAVSFFQALAIIRKFRPHAIIGTGGYASWPVLRAGVLSGVQAFIQEQNIKPGLVTRVMAPKVNTIFTSYVETEDFLKGGAERIVAGNPTRMDLDKSNKSQGLEYFKLRRDRKTIFVFGGSQGSLFINNLMETAAPLLVRDYKIQILWAAGPRWAEMIKEKINNPNIKIYPYIENMAAAYGASDLVVCRSGATTIAEITRLGIPALFIPFAAAADNHQEKNAEILCSRGAGAMIREREADPEKVVSTIVSLLDNEGDLKKLAENARSLGKPNAAHTIVKHILEKISV